MEPMNQEAQSAPEIFVPEPHEEGIPVAPRSKLNTIGDLMGLLEYQLGRWKRDCIETVETKPGLYRFRFYTSVNVYSITAKEPLTSDSSGYLGCGSSCRKPRPGEDWTRGNDLYDGPFTMETWNKIMADIVAYEVVELAKGVNILERNPICGP